MDSIINAKDSPVPGVKDFSDIDDLDIDSLDGIVTNIKPLDRYLMKLFYGTLNIFTGVNGSGKSSFINTIVCQALDQDKNVFLYSGELPNFQTKNWINYVFAGQRNVQECQSGESTYWKVTPEAKRKISDYYRGKLFVYEDGLSNKKSDLFRTMEDSVRKYGVKLLVLDNMTSMNLENNDDNKYDKQAELVTDLISFAVKYNVTIILVVHPHKIETMRRLTKMDVQGISAIIALALRIVSLYRVQPNDKKGEPRLNGKGWKTPPIKYDVLCDILKDRMLGYEGRSIGLYYDRPSRRFFTDEVDLDHQYAWDKTNYKDPLPFPPEQLQEKNDEDEVFGSDGGE
jgi:KaiC/GvpD/RAD55 family RecA-like ATPase